MSCTNLSIEFVLNNPIRRISTLTFLHMKWLHLNGFLLLYNFSYRCFISHFFGHTKGLNTRELILRTCFHILMQLSYLNAVIWLTKHATFKFSILISYQVNLRYLSPSLIPYLAETKCTGALINMTEAARD